MNFSYIDGHCDTIYHCYCDGRRLRKNTGKIDLERGGKLGHYAQVFAMFYDPCDDMRRHLDGLHDCYVRELEANRDIITRCDTAADIEKAWSEGKMAALMSIEGADLMDCDPDNVELVRSWGTRLINITWSVANRLSGSCSDEAERGLTALGREFVKTAQSAGIYMDVSHISEKGFWDLVDITQMPIVASHSDSKAVFAHERGLTDAQAREIAATGGIVGVNFYAPFLGENPTIDDIVRHVEHYLDVCGENTVAIGSDFDGGAGVPGVEGVEAIPNLYRVLEKRGYGSELLDKLFCRNWLRLL